MTNFEITYAISSLARIKVEVVKGLNSCDLMDFEDSIDFAIRELGNYYIKRLKSEAEQSALENIETKAS